MSGRDAGPEAKRFEAKRLETRRLEPIPFDGSEIGRLTWIGLSLAGIGWALLLGETACVDILAMRRSATFHGDLAEIAKCLVASGFGLAVVGALQTGFGALNRFFAAVLTRSAQRAMPVAPSQTAPSQTAPMQTSPLQTSPLQTAPLQAAPNAEPAAPVRKVSKRNYRLQANGSVEVDTILGTRLFQTMDEARDFI